MKLLTEYLDRAVALERLAAGEPDSTFKTQLLEQATAYRKLAAKRAKEFGLPPPSPPKLRNWPFEALVLERRGLSKL
jgi:hypothetical protein